MDIHDDLALRRPLSFVLNLRRLPTELVHHILIELPLLKVLQILAHKDQHLTNCVLSSPRWGDIFNNKVHNDELVDLFILYIEICRFTRRKFADGFHILQAGPSRVASETCNNSGTLATLFVTVIEFLLPCNNREMALLTAHATYQHPGGTAPLVDRWQWAKEAKRNQNKEKAQQLLLAADLITNFPTKLMVKKPTDPSQGAPRRNLRHIESGLRLRAKKALQNGQLTFSNGSKSICRKGTDNIELLPYDRYLCFFMDMLKEHPFEGGINRTATPEMLSRTGEIDGSEIGKVDFHDGGSVFEYPAVIRQKIQAILDGLLYVYTGCPQLVVERIK